METIAFYRETIIKTYGFIEKTGLYLITADFPLNWLNDRGVRLLDLPSRIGDSLELLMARTVSEGTLRVHLLLEKSKNAQGLAEAHRALVQEGMGDLSWRVEEDVEMIFFQGPHYGDRYGIACAALTALTGHNVPILAMACTGASVYLILPRGKANSAKEVLGTAFWVPDRVKREPV
jgi:hypothetical protein